jgi:hypothetical protein
MTTIPDSYRDGLRATFDAMERLGVPSFELTAGDLYRTMGGSPRTGDRLSACCAVLRSAMEPGDEILVVPPEGEGAQLRIRYRLPRSGGAPAKGSEPNGVQPNHTVKNSSIDAREIVEAFVQVATLADVRLHTTDVRVEFYPAPHVRPSGLPPGTQGVYSFALGDTWLKVGKAGPKSVARFCSQHYTLHAPSTLAKSILAHPQELEPILGRGTPSPALHASEIGAWIETYTSRMNVLIPSQVGPFALSLLEAFLQCRLRPLFEGPGGLNFS